eukprot:2654888-Pleurochrysis_carterae.AAC.1
MPALACRSRRRRCSALPAQKGPYPRPTLPPGWLEAIAPTRTALAPRSSSASARRACPSS